MYKLRLGFVLLKKYLLLNLVAIIQLTVILVTINMIIIFSGETRKFDAILADYADANLFKCYDNHFNSSKVFDDVVEFLPEGTEIFRTNSFTGYSDKEKTPGILAIDNGLLSRLNYEQKEGRWLTESDRLTANAVLSYNENYAVGDVIHYRVERGTRTYEYDIKIVGILKRGEKELSFGAGTSAKSFFRQYNYDDETIRAYVSRNFFEQTEGFLANAGGPYINYFKLSEGLPYDEYLSVISNIKTQNYFCFSAEQLIQFDKSELRGFVDAFVPISALVFVLAALGFFITASITVKTSECALDLVKKLGGEKGDLMQILSCYIGAPIIFVGILFFTVFSVMLPLSMKYSVLSYINYLFTFAALALFFLLNFALLGVINHFKYKKRRITDEDK